MNKIYRIGHEEPGIAEFQISKFGNSEMDSLPLTKWAALGSFSALPKKSCRAKHFKVQKQADFGLTKPSS